MPKGRKPALWTRVAVVLAVLGLVNDVALPAPFKEEGQANAYQVALFENDGFGGWSKIFVGDARRGGDTLNDVADSIIAEQFDGAQPSKAASPDSLEPMRGRWENPSARMSLWITRGGVTLREWEEDDDAYTQTVMPFEMTLDGLSTRRGVIRMTGDGRLVLDGVDGEFQPLRNAGSAGRRKTGSASFKSKDVLPMALNPGPERHPVYIEPLTGSRVSIPPSFDAREYQDEVTVYGMRRTYFARNANLDIAVEEIDARCMGDVIEHIRPHNGLMQILWLSDNCVQMYGRSGFSSREPLIHWAYLLDDGSIFHVSFSTENRGEIEVRDRIRVEFAAEEGSAGLRLKTDFSGLPAVDIAGAWHDPESGFTLDIPDGVIFGLYRDGAPVAYGEYDGDFLDRLESIAAGSASAWVMEDGGLKLSGVEAPLSRVPRPDIDKSSFAPLPIPPDVKELVGEWVSDDGTITLTFLDDGRGGKSGPDGRSSFVYGPTSLSHNDNLNLYKIVENDEEEELLILTRNLTSPESSTFYAFWQVFARKR